MEYILIFGLIILFAAIYLLQHKEIAKAKKLIENNRSSDETRIIAETRLVEREKDLQKFIEELSAQEQKSERLNQQILVLSKENSELIQTNRSLEERLVRQKEEFLEMKQQMQSEFRLLAQEILEEKSKRFTETNKTNIEHILSPLSDNLKEFRKQVEEAYGKESQERFSLEKSIKELMLLNNRISDEANNLTKALKGDSKVQGDWGEMILESILSKSGLVNGREYYTQEYLTDEDNRKLTNEEGHKMRPDAIIEYPDGRKVIIDSKVSLTAYVRYCESDDPDVRKVAAQDHLNSIKRHIDELSRKEYDKHNDSLDFVMMFVPNEAAFFLAVSQHSDLWNYAYDKRIILINPTNLITALKLIADLWKREYQNRNALEIAERGGRLYDKFVSFVDHLKKVGDSIEKSQKGYDDAMKVLSEGKGNLLNQAEQLRKMGVKNRKQLAAALIDDDEE